MNPFPLSWEHSPGERASSPKVSVILVTHQSAADIAECLRAVAAAAVGIPAEILLVDAGSTDATIARAHTSGLLFRLVPLRNVGFAAAANAGARHATGELLLFLNPDTRMERLALSLLTGTFSAAPVSAVGGTLVDFSGRPDTWQNVPFASLPRVIWRRLLRAPGSRRRPTVTEQGVPYSVPWVSGGALTVRASVFRRLGGFREGFFLYFEDMDLCRRIRLSGGLVLLHPAARVLHRGGMSADARQRLRAYERSQDLYIASHRSRAERFLLRIARVVWRHAAFLAVVAFTAVAAVFLTFSASGDVLWPLLGVVALLVILMAARWPSSGVVVLFATIVVGQSVRLPLGALGGTFTDVALPFVLLGWFFRIASRHRLPDLARQVAAGWWVPAAAAPGLLLALERLPASELAIAVSYAARVALILLLVPFLRVLRVRAVLVRSLLLATAVMLAVIGVWQLVFVPLLPPETESVASRLLLAYSGGGWDPHARRLFATWLDPNFLGGFFLLALALLLGSALVFPLRRAARLRSPALRSHLHFLTLSTSLALGLMFLAAIALTQSRATLLALVVVLLLWTLLTNVRRLLFPIVTGMALVFFLFPSLVRRLDITPWDDPTVRLRLQSLQQAVGHAERFPLFGVGYNAYGGEQVAAGALKGLNIHSRAGADNVVLTLLATTGLWGTVLVLGGILGTLRRLLTQYRRGVPGAFAALLTLFALLVHSQFLQSFTYVHLLVPVALLLGSVLPCARRLPQEGIPILRRV